MDGQYERRRSGRIGSDMETAAHELKAHVLRGHQGTIDGIEHDGSRGAIELSATQERHRFAEAAHEHGLGRAPISQIGIGKLIEKDRRSVIGRLLRAQSSRRIMQLEIRDQIANPKKWQQVEIELVKMQEHGGIEPERARVGFSARIEQLLERKIGGFRHPLPVFLKSWDVVLPQIGRLQPVLIMAIEERTGRDVQFQLAQWLSAARPAAAAASPAPAAPPGKSRYIRETARLARWLA